MDRGFLFGDGVYEMIPVYGDYIFRLEQHLLRLQNSLDAIDIPNPYSHDQWETLIGEVLHKNPYSDHRSVYIEITRGAGDRNHIYEDGLVPTVFILCREVDPNDRRKGVRAITHKDIRWDYCDIKSISLLPAVLLKQIAKHSDGAHEAILIKDGVVTEGAASNVFMVKNGKVLTPPKDNRLLSGITRDLIIELLNENSIPCEEKQVTDIELRNAEEIWITSSVMEIVPVIQLDGNNVGNGLPGNLWKKIHELFEAYKKDIIETFIISEK
ncbi:MAG: aminotransferase class IV [Gammaproteobacteria bacterium]